MRTSLLLSVLLSVSTTASAQIVESSRGREFYCMVMRFNGTPTFGPNPEYIRVFLSSSAAARATVEVRGIGFSQSVNVAPDVVTTVTLPWSVEDTSAETVTQQAIHITADTDISAYVIYHKLYSTDSYLVLPVTALGTEYEAICYPTSVQFHPECAPEVGIVGVTDSTLVTILPSANTYTGRRAGASFSVMLNRGDTYLVYGDSTDWQCDLTGTRVTSTKPIAVVSGHERTEIFQGQGQSRDCLVEQLPPDSTLGSSFITVPFEPRPYPVGDYFRVVAPYDSTDVMVNGRWVRRLMAHQFWDTTVMVPLQIQTSNRVLVGQYALSATNDMGQFENGGGFAKLPWDPALMIIPPTQQFLDEYTFANSIDTAFISSYVNVVIPDTAVASLRLDGRPVTTPFTPVPGSGYSYAQIPDSQGSHNISATAPFGIYVYGYGPADSYANTGGAAFRVLRGLLVTTDDVDFGTVPTDTCKDSSIVFRNIGNAPITVWNLWLTDSAAGDFTVVGGGPPFTLAPGESHTVMIRFCPGAQGFRGRTFVRVTSNAVESPTITMHGVGVLRGLMAEGALLDFHTVRVAWTKDSTYLLRNTGEVPIVVDTLRLIGPDAANFSVVAPVGRFTVAVAGSQQVTVRFQPAAETVDNASVQAMVSGIAMAAMPVTGRGALPHLAVLPDTIDFHRVKLGRFKDSLAVLQASGLLPTQLATMTIGGPNATEFLITSVPSLPAWLASGDTMPVPLRFVPATLGPKLARLIVTGDAAESTVVAVLIADARASQFTTLTATDTIRGRIGDVVQIPVHLLSPLDNAGVDRYHVTLTYDSTMLYPVDVTPVAGWSASAFAPVLAAAPGISDVHGSVSPPAMLSGTGTLYVIDMMVLWGDALSTPLTLTVARYTDVDGDSTTVVSAVQHGLFLLDSLCGGPNNLLKVSGSVALRDVAPNPVSTAALVGFATAGADPVHVGVVDALGREVLVLADGVYPVGVHAAVLSAAALPAGAYRVCMRTGAYHRSAPVLVVR